MKKERGQALLILAFALIALAAFAGLAIDGGRLYALRRQAQNTADAAAVAGARVLAQSISTCQAVDRVTANNQVATAMVDLVRANGIDPAVNDAELQAWYVDAAENNLGRVEWGAGVPDRATGIRATLTITEGTTFLRIVGQQTFNAPGNALAMTGPIMQFSGGVIPLGVPLEVIRQLRPGEHFYMMEKNNKWGGGAFCRDPDGDLCIGDPAAANAHRGWLNLNYIYNTEHRTTADPLNRAFERNVTNKGCGGDPNHSIDDGLQGWAGDGCPYPFPIFAGTPGYINGDFIHGDPGARESTVMDVKAAWGGKIAYVPIFDYIYMGDYMAKNFQEPENLSWPRAGGGGHAYFYHIVGFAAVLIDGDSAKHTIAGEFQSAIVGDSQIAPGQGFSGSGGGGTCNPFAIAGVQLWR
ncbi:MAG TPA: pilus assembly protein TadG-related protein [Anaerolineae bacterium]|nr:pilus assembly protein TadG-related protein [Anaerolineae bacterium]HQI85903.1 pilus assembly protein TadG-related protein [Anaerolineae bacterium]